MSNDNDHFGTLNEHNCVTSRVAVSDSRRALLHGDFLNTCHCSSSLFPT